MLLKQTHGDDPMVAPHIDKALGHLALARSITTAAAGSKVMRLVHRELGYIFRCTEPKETDDGPQ